MATETTPQITLAKLDNLIPYANNARVHSDEQIAQIAASIKEFGWTNPILVDGDNGIIAGHGRVQAARKLKQEYVPVIELNGLSEAQRRAYILADNRLAQNADWDFGILEIEIANLQDLDFDLNLTGFDATDLDNLGFVSGEVQDFESEVYGIANGNDPAALKESYESSSIRQMVLVFMADEFTTVVEAMGNYAEDNSLSNNTEVVKHLLESNGYAISERQTEED
jgi:hypothetical protein